MNEFKSMGDFIFEGREPDLRVPPPHILIEMLRPPYLLYANEFEVSATFNMNGYRPMIRTHSGSKMCVLFRGSGNAPNCRVVGEVVGISF